MSNINQTIDLLSLLGNELRKSGTYHVGPCPFCGGNDRFTVKHTPSGDKWFCRQCGDGKYHSVADFVMHLNNCDYKTAVKMLGGEITPRAAKRTTQPKKHVVIPGDDWQSKSWDMVDKASDRLLSDDGLLGQKYLLSRGIQRGTWYAWHLGFTHAYDPTAKRNRPAITIPWFDMDEISEGITAVKIRFIDNSLDGLRYISLSGSKPFLFGLWDAMESDTTLLLVEGEFNALSIWQCRPKKTSVLSFGSEGNGRADLLKTISSKYSRVVLWLDEPDKAREYQSLIMRQCEKFQSLIINNNKMDANYLLRNGELSGLLMQLGFECD